jgi:hypothetical protein
MSVFLSPDVGNATNVEIVKFVTSNIRDCQKTRMFSSSAQECENSLATLVVIL